MNIFSIILTICCLSLFSAFIFEDISTIRFILIGALIIYLSELVFKLKPNRRTISKAFKLNTHNS